MANKLKIRRNKELIAEIERQMRRGGIGRSRNSVRHAVKEALRGPAPRFYVSEEYVIDRLQRRGGAGGWVPKTRLTARLWGELESALEQRRQCKPWESDAERVRGVLEVFRPSGYFISETYAMRLYNKKREMR